MITRPSKKKTSPSQSIGRSHFRETSEVTSARSAPDLLRRIITQFVSIPGGILRKATSAPAAPPPPPPPPPPGGPAGGAPPPPPPPPPPMNHHGGMGSLTTALAAVAASQCEGDSDEIHVLKPSEIMKGRRRRNVEAASEEGGKKAAAGAGAHKVLPFILPKFPARPESASSSIGAIQHQQSTFCMSD